MNILISSSGLANIGQFVGVLFMFAIVLLLTYLTTRWIANYQKVHIKTGNLKLIESIQVATGKYVQILKAGDEYLVIGVGKEEISLLSKLPEDQIELNEPVTGQKTISSDQFKELLDKIKNQKQEK
ncbi:MAG: flagellar biosynthetic protein FliO [Lachnospiraceae bacterium]